MADAEGNKTSRDLIKNCSFGHKSGGLKPMTSLLESFADKTRITAKIKRLFPLLKSKTLC
jgi:hypothetical protein